MKGLVQHTPTDDDISNLLKEFTVDFLLKGYNYLVEELHMQLMSNAVSTSTPVRLTLPLTCITSSLPSRRYQSIRRTSSGWSHTS